jgi:hypothetical protein
LSGNIGFSSAPADGVYCVTGNFNLSSSNISAHITIVATGQVKISGGGNTLTPYQNGVLAYSQQSSNNQDINVSGSGGSWSGLL